MAVIIPYDDEEEAVRIANDTIYGLAAGIWTGDINKAIRMAERIQAGTVSINNYFNAATQSPVGGFKQSGYEREYGFEGMRIFMQTKSVWLARHQSSSTGPVSGVTQALQTNAVPANGRIRCYV